MLPDSLLEKPNIFERTRISLNNQSINQSITHATGIMNQNVTLATASEICVTHVALTF
jgi:hypothetical protein